MENFAWNIRVLKGQADLLMQAKHDCKEYLRQVVTLTKVMCTLITFPIEHLQYTFWEKKALVFFCIFYSA